MNPPDTCLNLIVPSAIAHDVVELLLAQRDMRISFASAEVSAHGAEIPLLEPSEQVSGQAARVQFQMLLSREQSERLLRQLQKKLPNPRVFYWMTPVLQSGRLW